MRLARGDQTLRADRVHLPIRLGILLRGRIVRKPGEMADGVDTGKPRVVERAEIARDDLDIETRERLTLPEEPVEHDGTVSGFEELAT